LSRSYITVADCYKILEVRLLGC